MIKPCTHKACIGFAGRTRPASHLTLLTVCKDVDSVQDGGKPTGLTVTWKPGGWTLTDKQGRVLAEGGIDGRDGFSARHTDGGRTLRDADQFELIGKVAGKALAPAIKEAA